MRPTEIISSALPPSKLHWYTYRFSFSRKDSQYTQFSALKRHHCTSYKHPGSSVTGRCTHAREQRLHILFKRFRQTVCDFSSLFFNFSTMSLRSCRPCYTLKIRCTREVPRCQTCIKRGKCSSCVYETRVSDRKPALPEPQPKRQKRNGQKQKQQGELSDNYISWKAFEPQSEQSLQYETSSAEETQCIIEPARKAYIKHLDQRYPGEHNLEPHEMPPKSIAAVIAEKASISQPKYSHAAVEDILERPGSTSVSQPNELYAQMTPPVINYNLRGALRPQR